MSNLSDLAPLLSSAAGGTSAIQRADVVGVTEEGWVQVLAAGDTEPLSCEVLSPESRGATYCSGDTVLVWRGGGAAGTPCGVVLGRVGPHEGPLQTVADPQAFAAREKNLVIETQGDLVLRNGQARIKLGAQGDVEIVCTSFATRSQRLLRLLAPLIKLN